MILSKYFENAFPKAAVNGVIGAAVLCVSKIPAVFSECFWGAGQHLFNVRMPNGTSQEYQMDNCGGCFFENHNSTYAWGISTYNRPNCTSSGSYWNNNESSVSWSEQNYCDRRYIPPMDNATLEQLRESGCTNYSQVLTDQSATFPTTTASTINTTLAAATSNITNLAANYTEITTTLMPNVSDIISSATTAMNDMSQNITEGLTAEQTSSFTSTVAGTISDSMDNATETISTMFENITTTLSTLMQSTTNFLTTNVTKALTATTDYLTESSVDKEDDRTTQIINKCNNTVNGFWYGCNNANVSTTTSYNTDFFFPNTTTSSNSTISTEMNADPLENPLFVAGIAATGSIIALCGILIGIACCVQRYRGEEYREESYELTASEASRFTPEQDPKEPQMLEMPSTNTENLPSTSTSGQSNHTSTQIQTNSSEKKEWPTPHATPLLASEENRLEVV